jgi:uncharacterized protein YifE (UPF0438 family)
MPTEITDEKQFIAIAKSRASLCKIKKVKDVVKLKLRTPKMLYTFKTSPEKAEALLKDLEIERVDL